MSEDVFGSMTRRGLVGAGVAGGLLLAGCGGDDNGSSGGAPVTAQGTPSGARKRGGSLRFAPFAFARASTLDPQSTSGAYSLAFAMFDPLLIRDHDYKIQNALAEEFEPEGNDQSKWTIRLREGVTFHDGKPLTVDDVMYTIRKNLNPKTPGQSALLMDAIDPKNGMKKMDDRTLRLDLKYPNSQLRDGFAPSDTGILPEGFDPKNPIGTGPFKFQSWTPGQRWVGARNENYWRENQPYLDELVFIGFANPDVARVNALLAGQIDGLDQLPPARLPQVEQNSKLQTLLSDTGVWQVFSINVGKGQQFEDKRVRTAFKLIIDRPQMIQAIWSGYGKLGNDIGVWPEIDPAVNPNLPQTAQDIEQAKSLLKAAGKEGMTVELRTAALAPGMLESAAIFQQNAKEAGVTIKLDVVADAAQYYSSDAYYTSQLKSDRDATETMYKLTSYAWLGRGVYNNTGYNDPRVNRLYKESLAAGPDEYLAKMHELSKIIHEEGPYIVPGRQTVIDAYSTKFTGASPDIGGLGFNGYLWHEISLA